MDKRKNEQGFTLVEIILSLAILSIILILTTSFFSTDLNIFSLGIHKAQLQFDSRILSNKVSEELRFAELVTFDEGNPEGLSNSFSADNIDDIIGSDYSHSIEFYTTTNPQVIRFRLSTTDTKTAQSFSIETDVALLNTYVDLDDFPAGSDYGQIYYEPS